MRPARRNLDPFAAAIRDAVAEFRITSREAQKVALEKYRPLPGGVVVEQGNGENQHA